MNATKYDIRKYNSPKVVRQTNPAKYAERESDYETLYQAWQDWNALELFRRRARRCVKYSDGDQWSDLVDDPERPGRKITESEHIRRQGKVPLVQNKIGSIVRNILGQYRNNADKSVVMVRDPKRTDEEEILTNVLQAIAVANQIDELDAQALNYFLHAGVLAQRIAFRRIKELDRMEVYVENIDYNRLFFNPGVKDVRLNDLCRIGAIHDMNRSEFLAAFCKNDADKQFLENRFDAETSKYNAANNALSGDEEMSLDFIAPQDRARIRVYECWQLETEWKMYVYDRANATETVTDLSEKQIQNINRRRMRQVEEYNSQQPDPTQQIPRDQIALVRYQKIIEPVWKYKYLLADGTVLQKGTTPYAHQEHPFIIRLFPMLSGNVYGIVNQLIDQQRMINRTVALWDFIIGAGAKGVLMIPEDMLGDATPEQFAEQWRTFNGVIVYKPSRTHNQTPAQITANAVPAGVYEMLNIQLQLIQDISGVHGAIQGKDPAAGTSGSLYKQETMNAAINTLDIMKIQAAFKQVRDRKILKTAIQFYNGTRRIITSDPNNKVIDFDPEKIRDVDFDVQIIQNTDAPAYRAIIEDRLIQLVQSGMLPREIYFQNSSDPTNRKIYEDMKKMQQQNPQQPVPQEIADAAKKGNPQAIQMIQQAIGQSNNNQQNQ